MRSFLRYGRRFEKSKKKIELLMEAFLSINMSILDALLSIALGVLSSYMYTYLVKKYGNPIGAFREWLKSISMGSIKRSITSYEVELFVFKQMDKSHQFAYSVYEGRKNKAYQHLGRGLFSFSISMVIILSNILSPGPSLSLGQVTVFGLSLGNVYLTTGFVCLGVSINHFQSFVQVITGAEKYLNIGSNISHLEKSIQNLKEKLEK